MMLDMADLNIGEDLAQRRSFIRKEMKRTNKIMEKVIGKYYTVKPVLSCHSQKYQKMVFKTEYRLMQVKSIAECSKRAFCNIFDLH